MLFRVGNKTYNLVNWNLQPLPLAPSPVGEGVRGRGFQIAVC